MINLNDKSKFNAEEISIFNNGEAGIVRGVEIRVESKGPDDKENAPDYKLFAKDDKGEVNEGFYYQDDDAKAFLKFQSQKLIWLARGITGNDKYEFPEFESAKEALAQTMKFVAKEAKGKRYNVIVTYGAKSDPQRFLNFKEFGRFICPADSDIKLSLSNSDAIERSEVEPSSDDEVNEVVGGGSEADEDWLNK